ncbi:uncharacterized protein LOC142328373 [Lycorma delicatula]|uniref:uncharacterized protein LOC142328373 n=1 Tax=Lycorma delicatula TaxID=130591 RepID=UPI003F519848
MSLASAYALIASKEALNYANWLPTDDIVNRCFHSGVPVPIKKSALFNISMSEQLIKVSTGIPIPKKKSALFKTSKSEQKSLLATNPIVIATLLGAVVTRLLEWTTAEKEVDHFFT